MSNSLWPHELQHARLPCPTLFPGVCWNSYPLSQWCHPAISSSVVPFSSCPQSLPASGSFLMSWPFVSGSQNVGASSSASILPMNIQDWVTLWLDLLAVQETLQSIIGEKSQVICGVWFLPWNLYVYESCHLLPFLSLIPSVAYQMYISYFKRGLSVWGVVEEGLEKADSHQ